MKPQARGLQYSLIIHAAVIAGVLGLGTLEVKKHHPMIIDFDLEKPTPAPVQKIREPTPIKSFRPASKKVPQAAPAPVPREENKRLPPPAPPKIQETAPTWIQSTSDMTVPVEQPGLPNVPGGLGKTDGPAGGTGKSGISGSGPASGKGGTGGEGGLESGGAEKAKNRYLAEQFAYIRDKILKNVSYPSLARRLGWEGRVVLSFVITLSGSIKEAQVVRGSGYEVLDQGALEALKESVPFPHPPVEAQIKIPVVYRLN